jgi:hypothetical protein
MKEQITLRSNIYKLCSFLLATIALSACETAEIDPITTQNPSYLEEMECHEINFNGESTGLISFTHTDKGAGPVAIMGRKRNPNGTFALENHAAIFDSQAPTGDDDDLYTTDWGNVLIVNQDLSDIPNDNQYGAEIIIDFSAIGPVTMRSMKALDIDGYEMKSWVYLYDSEDTEIYKIALKPLGDNSKQNVNLGNTEGVMKMKVILDGVNADELAGSGAIDEIKFCVPKYTPDGCTKTQGYWKNHADPEKKQYDDTWKDFLNADFFSSGMTYLEMLNKSTGGDAYVILAHQYIAAELNVKAGAFMPSMVKMAFDNATNYFKEETTPAPPRESLIRWSEILDEYNNGKSAGGPGHCD